MHARTLIAKPGVLSVVAAAGGALFASCVDPPPKIATIPPSGLSLRVYVFGASAQDARQAFEAARQTNKQLRIVHEGGDGEVLVGLENDSPKCVAPTALCSFKVAVRIRDNDGKVVHASTMNAAANAERCADLCERALNTMVVKVIEAAAANLKVGSGDLDASNEPGAGLAEPGDGGELDAGAAVASAGGAPPKPPVKKSAGKGDAGAKADPAAAARSEPAICVVGHGQHLPSEEAERRAAQVEALKRIEILDEDEYDCLRKAYLDRL